MACAGLLIGHQVDARRVRPVGDPLGAPHDRASRRDPRREQLDGVRASHKPSRQIEPRTARPALSPFRATR
jgi:hypothetical protein